MICDCIFFEIGKEPYIDQVDPEKQSVSFGENDKGVGIWRRIGTFSKTSSGVEEKYLYVSEHVDPPSKYAIGNAVDKLKPKPYIE